MWQLIGMAATFTWLGMVLAISFVETPLKFRAPGITVGLGLGIGRLVFRALNIAEIALFVIIVAATGPTRAGLTSWVLLLGPAALLVVQLVVVRPRLDRRARQVISGQPVPPSRQHLAYIALECIKVAALIALGTSLNSR